MMRSSTCFAAVLLGTLLSAEEARRPNFILIITDDQGYGDLGIHGNPVVRTPNLDRLGKEGVRFQRFYVCPVCAPTRASLLTGRYNYRTGILDTYQGRAMMEPGEVTLAEMLSPAGYRTGIFGKWHLGDNYPMRPMDQGFQESLVHRGGGIGQPSDPPGGTSYFDPVLSENGKLVKVRGYASDIFTSAAIQFVEKHSTRPFFLYLAFNCPHTPLEVPESYHGRYKDADLTPDRFPKLGHPVPSPSPAVLDATARIYGMVENIDDNMGKLLAKLDELHLTERTMVIFLTDNGPQQPRYNAGMLERKGSVHEGGIRVPSFWRWPGKLQPGKEVVRIAAHIDVVPTVLEAAGLAAPPDVKLDGRSLWPLLTGAPADWPDRQLFFQWHRGDAAELHRAFAARSQRYKLVQPIGANGTAPREKFVFKLFDMEKDPLEERDIASEEPEVLARMKEAYEAWYRDVTKRGFEPPRIVIDGVHENPATLTRQDWRGPKAGGQPRPLGYWEIEVAGPARPYDILLRFEASKSGGKAVLEVGDLKVEKGLEAGVVECMLEKVNLPPGSCRFSPWIEDSEGAYGVHQAEIRVHE